MHFKKGMRHPAHYKTDEPWKQHAWWKKPDTKGHGTWDSFVPNSRTGTQKETLSRREASRPGSGTGCGPPWLGLGQRRGGDPYGYVDLLTLMQLRLWHRLHSSGNRLKMLKCASETGRFYGM